LRVRVRVATTFAAAAVVLSAALGSAGAQPAASAEAASQAAAQTTHADPVDMVHAKKTFQTLCSKCHDLGLVTSQNHDRAGWNEVIQKMRGFNFVASDEETREILEYLVANLPGE
jgi:cytochrome c5